MNYYLVSGLSLRLSTPPPNDKVKELKKLSLRAEGTVIYTFLTPSLLEKGERVLRGCGFQKKETITNNKRVA